jgi:hemerythrin-like domain-containing protein
MDGQHSGNERRRFLRAVASGATLVAAGCATPRGGTRDPPEPGAAEAGGEISPGEDLMREHGVLARILLVYEEYARRLDAREQAPVEVLDGSAGIVRRFIEDYHERLEEQFLFPRFEAAGRERELVATLRAQHARGRALTDRIVALGPKAAAERAPLAQALRSFSRMYRPHAAREDTVLFPAFRELVGAAAYRELGEQFEEREHALLGEHGFADAVREIAGLERALGIHDLARFTPG